MKTTLSLLALFVLVLGGGYAWSQYQSPQPVEVLPATPSEVSYDDSDMRKSDNSGKGSDDDERAAPAVAVGSYTLVQVSAHASGSDCWTAISGSVYNLTAWIARHPGGQSPILGLCGKDGTSAFSRMHGNNAQAQAALANFRIGALAQ